MARNLNKVGVMGAVLAPVLAAIGALAALLAACTIGIKRIEETSASGPVCPPGGDAQMPAAVYHWLSKSQRGAIPEV